MTLNAVACCGQCGHSRPGGRSVLTPLAIVAIIAVCSCVCRCASVGNATSPSCGQETTLSNETRSGRDLWCYECRETYVKKYNIVLSPCLNNLSLITVRQCGALDLYCKVERIDLHLSVMTIERSCTQSCPYGCKYYGYGLTYRRCTSCCRTFGCNGDSGVQMTTVSLTTFLFLQFLMACMMADGL